QQQTQNSSPERYKEEVDTPSKAPDYTTGSVSFQSGSFNTSTLFNIPPIEPPGTKLKNAYLIMIGVMIGIFLVGSGIILFLKPPEKSSPGSATNAKTTPPSGMVYIEGGTFKMGDDRGESFDAPSHEVTVKPFFIDKMEVTNQDYKKFIDETNSSPPQNWKGYQFPPGTDLKPVTGIDWQQAASYAKWAGKRLPTEIEWEYAARGKDGRAYPWGDDWKEGAAVSKELKVDNPMPKGSIPTGASPFGILDMSGNVSEWTADNFTLYEGNKGKLDQKLKSMKVVRGGSYKSEKKFVTTYSRIPLDPLFKDPSLGFRCVKSIE
ncbi:MAG: formylglycine-generating enzyme family protein, partial [Blastocatellia bacterium]|nr:formylglycine-generating enzyme family protein [Blastocatellia bacterium]